MNLFTKQKYELIAKSQLKKIRNLAAQDIKKAANKLAKEVFSISHYSC